MQLSERKVSASLTSSPEVRLRVFSNVCSVLSLREPAAVGHHILPSLRVATHTGPVRPCPRRPIIGQTAQPRSLELPPASPGSH